MQKEENNLLTNVCLTTIGLVTVYNIKRNYELNKEFNNKEITILNPKEFKAKFTKEDRIRIKKLKLSEDVLKFKKTLEKHINKNYLNNMYNNLKTLNTKEQIFFLKYLMLHITIGNYTPEKNLIKVNKFFKNDVINHELLHSVSSYYDEENEYAYVGFCQVNYKNGNDIGRALNEGYTQVLCNRYFGTAPDCTNSYKISQLLVEQIEKIIGKEKMEEAYFKADLNMLIKELEQYDTRENIISVIDSLDFIFKYLKQKNDLLLGYKIKKYLNISLENIQTNLSRWYTKKLQKDLNNKTITKLQFKNNLIHYKRKTYSEEILEKMPKKKIKSI